MHKSFFLLVLTGSNTYTGVTSLSAGTLQVGDGNTTGDSFVLGRNQANKVKVPLTTIANLAIELKLPRVDFVKMDIEGAEKEALRGGAETIRRYHPRMAIASEHLPDDVPESTKNRPKKNAGELKEKEVQRRDEREELEKAAATGKRHRISS